MKNEQCPPQDDLSAFVRCQVSEEQAESISEHVANCPQCEETVVGLQQGADTVFDRLKGIPASFPFQDEPELLRMAQAAKQLPPDKTAGTSEDPPPVAMLEQLRDYRIVEKIGEGGMGAVYRALHTRLNKTVALKVLSSSRLTDESAIGRFQREISIVGTLQHPNIVQAHDAGEHDGQHYLVMEYVAGSDLSDIVKRCSPLAIADACELISQAAIGLQYAHEHGFVHRDIKPSNLMLATAGHRPGEGQPIVKILDLGLARALDQPAGAAPAADLTTTGQVMGTLDYMAPEQGGDAHQVDIRADIYSLGATLYKLLTGDSPFAEHAHKPPLQRLMAVAQSDPPAIRSKRPDVPEKLAAIVHRMLAKEPERRFATPDEVVHALEPYCAGADLGALLEPHSGTRAVDGKSQVTASPKQSHGARGTGRNWSIALAGFAAAVFLAAIVLITTRHGTVEVTSPDGKLPDDVKVVVSQGGEEVELLQAENQWSAKVVNGEYQVQLRGGNDRFEIKDSKLIISRLGRVAVAVELRKSVTDPQPAVVADLPSKPTEPETKSPAPMVLDKPFILVRDGKDQRSFKSLAGAIVDLQAGDIVEIRSNKRLMIQVTEPITKPLTIRAGTGYRPLLAFGPAKQGHYLSVHADFTVENCDLDYRVLMVFGDYKSACVYRGCRIWGSLGIAIKRLSATDCVLILFNGVSQNDVSTESSFDNCLIRNVQGVFFASETESHTLRLRKTVPTTPWTTRLQLSPGWAKKLRSRSRRSETYLIVAPRPY